MAITKDGNSYTDKDFGAIRRRLFQLIRSVFPKWTDEDVADFGNILVELFARTGDILTFYQDRQANESRLTTALLRKSMLAFGRLVGFKATGAIAAFAFETFTLVNSSGVPTAAAADVVLPKGTIVRTLQVPNAARFQLLEDLLIPAGQVTATATVENSIFQSDGFISSSLKNQTFRLTQAPYLDGSATASAANGAYLEVPSLLSSNSIDNHFTIAVDQNDSATARFGNGSAGAIPVGTVTWSYRTWGGLVGRLAADTLTKIDGAFSDANGTPVRVVVTNPDATSIGIDRQSVERLRELLPLATRVPRAAVAREDYEIGALQVPTVARALHLTSNEDPAVGENQGFLFIIPIDGSEPSLPLLELVRAQFFQVVGFPKPPLPSMSTYQLTILGAPRKLVNIHAKLFKRKGFTGAKLKASVIAALTSFLAVQNADGSTNKRVDFGFNLQDVDGVPTMALAYSDLYDVVHDADGVLKISAGDGDFLVNGLRADMPLDLKDFPQLGSITLVDADTGAVL